MAVDLDLEHWSSADAADLYEVARWGNGYFSVGATGHLLVHPDKDPTKSIDLKQLVDRLQVRGIDLPILLRFAEILQHRLGEIHGVFANAMKESGYRGDYCCVYPVKVNQQRQVVEEVLQFGKPFRFGLEAGSKPELLAVIALADNDTPIICNGFKDAEFIETAMLAQKIGRHIIPVVERFSELHLVLEYAEKLGVRPRIGMRVKLATRGSGRWQASGGFRSKFGLTASELLKGLELLASKGMEDCLQLLHFHQGSQITNIRHIKAALNEASRIYTELVKRGAGLKYLDVGGGLGVDYDGSQTNFESSVNYSLQEYANDVVYHVQNACDEAGVPHPTIVSESGRAIVAYHSMLIFGVLGVSEQGGNGELPVPGAEVEQPLLDLYETARELPRRPAGARHGDEPVRERLPAARSTVVGRERLLVDLPENLQALQAVGVRAGGTRGARGIPLRHLFLQLLPLPVDPRQLGDQAALSRDADSPAQRAAHPRGRARRRHL
jgi:arginine decarboxylase